MPTLRELRHSRWVDTQRFTKYVVAGLAIFILVEIAYFHPFFGLMDDAFNLRTLLPRIENQGLLRTTVNYVIEDIPRFGFFRPTYLPMVYVIYKFGEMYGPVPYFVLNALIVFSILYLSAAVLERFGGVDRWLVLLFALAFPYTYDLLQHPSLQEKLVLLFGALLLVASLGRNLGKFQKALLVTLWTVLGLATKAQFVFYLVAGFVAVIASTDFKNKKDWLLLGYIAAMNVVGILFLAYTASRGGYSSGGYSISHILSNLTGIHGLFFVAVLSAGAILLVRTSVIRDEVQRLVPLVGVLSFFVLLLPWKFFGGYLLSAVVPFLGVLVLQILRASFKRRIYWLPGLLLAAVLMASYRPYSMFMRLNDIRALVGMATSLEGQGITEIHMPCEEGSYAVDYFLKRFGQSSIEVSNTKSLDAGPLDGKVVFYDFAMCGPLSLKPAQSQVCQEVTLYESSYSMGYRLARLDCGG